MDRIELIAKCRYYSGEEKNPYIDEQLQRYWDMERFYVEAHGELNAEMDEYYRNIKGKEYAGIPRALLIMMFTYWGKGTYDIAGHIRAFYELIDGYLDVASEGFPRDQVPKNRKR